MRPQAEWALLFFSSLVKAPRLSTPPCDYMTFCARNTLDMPAQRGFLNSQSISPDSDQIVDSSHVVFPLFAEILKISSIIGVVGFEIGFFSVFPYPPPP